MDSTRNILVTTIAGAILAIVPIFSSWSGSISVIAIIMIIAGFILVAFTALHENEKLVKQQKQKFLEQGNRYEKIYSQLKEESTKLSAELEETRLRLKEANAKIEDNIIKASQLLYDERNGNNLLFMALTQDPAEPLKVSLLEKAASEHENSMAAIILGSIYEYGIEKNGLILQKGEIDKAIELYKRFAESDVSGVCDWQLGWFAQKEACLDSVGPNRKDELLCEARRHYERSMQKGFPKAKNSIANFMKKGWAGFEPKRDQMKMISYYIEASQQGDYYAALNSGHYYLEQSKKETETEEKVSMLENARERYAQAAKMNSPEGAVRVSMTELQLYQVTGVKEHLNKAWVAMRNSVKYGENEFSAVGYCLLGNLLSRYPEFQGTDIFDFLEIDKGTHKVYIECYNRAYAMFVELTSQGKKLSRNSQSYFDLLTKSFEDIKTPLFENI